MYVSEADSGGDTINSYDKWVVETVPDDFRLPTVLPGDVFVPVYTSTDAKFTHSSFYIQDHFTTAEDAFKSIGGVTLDKILAGKFGDSVAQKLDSAQAFTDALSKIAADGMRLIEIGISNPDALSAYEAALSQYASDIRNELQPILADELRNTFPGEPLEFTVKFPGYVAKAGFDFYDYAAGKLLDSWIVSITNRQVTTAEGSPDIRADVHSLDSLYYGSGGDDILIGSNLKGIQLSGGNDAFLAIGGDNSVELGAGKDLYIGGGGSDTRASM
jgi:hypothetical protein